jgi:copper oxidase (laccase) domain-containing protein
VAGIGPAVGADRYQVGPDVTGAAQRYFGPDLTGIARPDGTGAALFDLAAANRRVLVEAGLPEGQVLTSGMGTGREAGLFFSDREERPCGRFAAIARLRPEDGA